MQFLEALRAQGKYTFVMITHHMLAVARYVSRVVVLRDGGIFMDDAPEVVFARRTELVSSGILPPPIAQLHALLCDDRAVRVALNIPDFLSYTNVVEVSS